MKAMCCVLLLCSSLFLLAGKGKGDQAGKKADHPQMDMAVLYPADSSEFYMDAKTLEFIRPGLRVSIEKVTIPEDRRVEVELRFWDDRNQPLDRVGQTTPGSVSVSFILAVYDGNTRDYTAYTTRVQTSPITGDSAEQATSDRGGTWTDHGIGHGTYKYATALPADYNPAQTHSVAFYATRDLTEQLGKRYYDNEVYDFRPDGEVVSEYWAATDDATCNTCHGQLAFHGDRRRDVKLCVTCHNPQSIDPDTGNSVDMGVMIHKIHMGEDLPSVQAGTPYQLVGFRQNVYDYSHVAYPQDVRNCVSCHPESSPQSHIWYSYPTRADCGSCHDGINWETGEGHVAGPAADDSRCAQCHQPEGEAEFDISVIGSHTIPTRSSQLAGIQATILNVVNTAPGQNPEITFSVNNGDGSAIDPAELNRMRLYIAGPAAEPEIFFSANAQEAEFDGNQATFTFPEAIPEDASGTWFATADVYRFVDILEPDGAAISVREAAMNPHLDFSVTDPSPVPRREIVSMDKCNDCHDSLALHGGQRLSVNDCVTCHTPEGDDARVRPPEAGAPESIHFKYLIHRLHVGHNLENDFTVYGFRGSIHNYNNLRYPNSLADCLSCHLPGTYGLSVVEEARATPTLRDWYTPMEPAAAACLSCHDSQDAASHAFVNTAPFGEACAACHGPGKAFSVEKVHAR